MKSYIEEKKERRCAVNKNMKLVVLGSVLMGAVAAQAETLPQVVQSVNNTISATAEENRKTVVQLGSQMMQEREQQQQKEAAAHDQKLVKAAKAQQADLRGSIQKTNYVATTYQAGPKYVDFGDSFASYKEAQAKQEHDAENWVKSLGRENPKLALAKQQCTNAQRDPRNESCQYIYESLEPGWTDRFQNRFHQLLMVNYDSQPDRRNYVLSTLPQYDDQPAATTKQ